jgi:hypothetical protein
MVLAGAVQIGKDASGTWDLRNLSMERMAEPPLDPGPRTESRLLCKERERKSATSDKAF